MCRALILVLGALLLWPAFGQAQTLNYNDQKSVEIEVNRMVQEQLKKFQPEIDRQRRQAEALQAQFPQPPAATTIPAPAPLTCQKSGCSSELCASASIGSGAGAAVSSCNYLPFYECYKKAACAKVSDAASRTEFCRWQDTPELRACLTAKGGALALQHAGLQ